MSYHRQKDKKEFLKRDFFQFPAFTKQLGRKFQRRKFFSVSQFLSVWQIMLHLTTHSRIIKYKVYSHIYSVSIHTQCLNRVHKPSGASLRFKDQTFLNVSGNKTLIVSCFMTGRKSSYASKVLTGSLIHGTIYNFSPPWMHMTIGDLKLATHTPLLLVQLFWRTQNVLWLTTCALVDWLPWTTWLLSSPKLPPHLS